MRVFCQCPFPVPLGETEENIGGFSLKSTEITSIQVCMCYHDTPQGGGSPCVGLLLDYIFFFGGVQINYLGEDK